MKAVVIPSSLVISTDGNNLSLHFLSRLVHMSLPGTFTFARSVTVMGSSEGRKAHQVAGSRGGWPLSVVRHS